MTDQIDQITDTDVEDAQDGAGRRRRMFLTGAGIAGAAAIVGKSGVASAANDQVVLAGSTSGDETYSDGTVAGTLPAYGSTQPTAFENTASNVPIAGPVGSALRGEISDATNGGHAVNAFTNGRGHAIAGESFNTDFDENDASLSAKAATWGRHSGPAAGVEGVNIATGVALAGTANGVKGIVTDTTNGSHAVLGITSGAGHSVAGDTPADAVGPNGEGSNTTAATWGRHGGAGAGIGGVSAAGYGGEFIGGKAHVRLIQVDNNDLGENEEAASGAPTGEDHQIGELYADGDGKLFYNTANGANFVQLTAQVLFDDPQRAWDSRAGQAPANVDKGKINGGGTATIDLTQFTDVPAGASGVLVNVSVANTEGTGFATIFNGDTPDADRPLAAALAWTGVDTRASNSVIARPNAAGQIKVYVGSNATDVILDVSGYIV